jgi:hypothetical protein
LSRLGHGTDASEIWPGVTHVVRENIRASIGCGLGGRR